MLRTRKCDADDAADTAAAADTDAADTAAAADNDDGQSNPYVSAMLKQATQKAD